MTKYQIGDIITNDHFHYLVEHIGHDAFKVITYSLRRLEDNQIITSYATTADSNQYVRKVA